jgi:hypothetical protein
MPLFTENVSHNKLLYIKLLNSKFLKSWNHHYLNILALQYFLWVISMYGDYLSTATSALFVVESTI